MSTRNDLTFDRRLQVLVTEDLHLAVADGAARKKITIADYVRGAVSDRLKADGIRHVRLPDLSPEIQP